MKVLGFSVLFNFSFEVLVRRAMEHVRIILLSVSPSDIY